MPPAIDNLIDKGPTESSTEVKPNTPAPLPTPPGAPTTNDDSTVLPLSQSTDPRFADKPFDPNEFNKIKGEPEQAATKTIDPKLKEEEDKAAEREKALAEAEKLKVDEAKKKIDDAKAQAQAKQQKELDDQKAKDKLPFKPLKDLTKKAEDASSTDKSGTRNFEGFDEIEVGLLKKMSNEAFEFVRPRLLAEKELKNKLKETETSLAKAKEDSLPDNYFEHPQAFLLDKRYAQRIEQVDVVSREVGAWEKAIIACRGGEKWIEYQWDGKNNRYVPIERQPSREAERFIENKILEGREILKEAESSIHGIMQEHEIRSTKIRSVLRERENQIFPQYNDPEIVRKDANMKELADYLTSGGVGLENNILLSPLCKMYAHALKLQDQLEEANKETGKHKVVEDIKKNNGPTNSEINQGVTSKTDIITKGKDEIPFDPNAFERLKA